MRTRLAASLLAILTTMPMAAGQSPGSGDPSFPKDVPPAAPRPEEKPPAKPEPRTPPDGPRAEAGLIDLRPKFQRGQQTRYTMSIKSDNELSIPSLRPGGAGGVGGVGGGDKQQQTMEQEIGFALQVTETTPEDGATVELTYEKVKLSIKTGDTEMFYDSSAPRRPNDDSDLLEPMLKGLVGAKLTIRFDAVGNVKDIKGGGELGLPGMMGQLGIPTDSKSIGSLFGPIATSASGRGLYRVGEKWTSTDSVDTGPIGSFRMVTEHTLRSASGGSADVYFTGRIEPGSESGRPGSPFQVKDSRYQGKYVWDTQRGQLARLESEQEITIDPGAGSPTGGMKAKTTVRVEREKASRR